MKSVLKYLLRSLAIAAALGLITAQVFAGGATLLNADFAVSCPNCATDISGQVYTWNGNFFSNLNGPYSVQDDLYGSYSPSASLESQILTNVSVYALNTTGTLNTAVVRNVKLHFFSPVSGSPNYPNDVLPPCWQGDQDQEWPVLMNVFAGNNMAFPKMLVGKAYPGTARVNFNNYGGACYNQINKFQFNWYNVCIVHPSSNVWVVTSDACGPTGPSFQSDINYGTGTLSSQGGKKGQTVYYGDWRVPFQLTLTKP